MSQASRATPVRRALQSSSPLLSAVKDGLGAIEAKDRDCFDEAVRSAFADSLNSDEALRPGHDHENRWDYLLGHEASQQVIGVEPHSAKEDQVGKVIQKRARAIEQLRDHFRDGARVANWLWVASGAVHFASTEKTRYRLAQNGIEFVGTKVLPKHLPIVPPAVSPKQRAKGRRTAR